MTIEDVDFIAYTAEGEWDDPIVAGYSGKFFAESTCTDVQGALTVYDASGVRVGSTTISNFTVDGNYYSFTNTEVKIPNTAGTYYGTLFVVDNTNNGAPQSNSTDPVEWQPACYPQITSFTKTGQDVSLDHSRATLDFNLQLAAYGSNACHNKTAMIEIMSPMDDSVAFTMRLNSDDIEAALGDGFDFTVAISSEQAEDAKVTFTTLDAEKPATAQLSSVYEKPTTVDCTVNVKAFCLNNIESADDSTNSNLHKFTFDLDVEFNPNCGTLDASIDIVADGDYLTNISVDHNDIANAFECQCDSTIVLEAEFDSSKYADSTFYGQLDVRNG